LGNRRALKHGAYSAEMRALRKLAHRLITSAKLALQRRAWSAIG